MVAVIMQRASRNGMARFRKEFLPTRPTWPYGLETHIRIRQNLRKVQDLPKGFYVCPKIAPRTCSGQTNMEKVLDISIQDADAVQLCSRSTSVACEKSNALSKPIQFGVVFASANPLSFVVCVMHSAFPSSGTAISWRSAITKYRNHSS